MSNMEPSKYVSEIFSHNKIEFIPINYICLTKIYFLSLLLLMRHTNYGTRVFEYAIWAPLAGLLRDCMSNSIKKTC